LNIFAWNKKLEKYFKVGKQRKEFDFLDKYNKNKQVVAYEHLKKASLFNSKSFKVAMNQISLWIIVWLIYIPKVGA
jgi:hypothetical protein